MKEHSTPTSALLNWGLVSKYRNQLFGFAIIWIMLMHSNEFTPITENRFLSRYLLYDGWIRTGGVGVDVFLFLSGIGLYYAMLKKPSLKRFYRNRFKRILIPYLIIGTTYWIFKNFVISHTPIMFLRDLCLSTFVTHGNSTFWYVAALVPLYLIAPFILRLFQSKYRKPLLFLFFTLYLALNYVLFFTTPELFANTEKALTRIFIFILGCYFGKIVNEGCPMNKMWGVYCFLVLSCHALVPYWAEASGLMPSKIASRLWCNAAGFSLCILVPIILEVLQSDFLNRFLNFFGTISLELYLSHVALKTVVKKLCPDFPDWSAKKSVIVYFCILVTALVFSYLFHLVQTKVELACTKKRKESF